MSSNLPDSARLRVLQDKTLLLLVVAVTLGFAAILWPYYGAVFWAMVLAILFAPLQRRLAHLLRGRRTLAALGTVALILVVVILPSALIASSLLQDGVALVDKIRAGEIDLGRLLRQAAAAMPAWATGVLDRFELRDLGALQQRLSAGLMSGLQLLATRAFAVGGNTLQFIVSFFVMLYLLFFLLRDGSALWRRIKASIPLPDDLQRNLSSKFTNVIRATVKGTIVVAIVQGALGGLIFWLLDIGAPVLWGVVMAFLTLLPAVGTGLVWGPAAIYLLASGAVWQGIALIAYGIFVIGVVDNVLRPILVGRDTKIPDYVVLVSTLGGMAVFGLNGFVFGPVIAAMFIAVWVIVATKMAQAGEP